MPRATKAASKKAAAGKTRRARVKKTEAPKAEDAKAASDKTPAENRPPVAPPPPNPKNAGTIVTSPHAVAGKTPGTSKRAQKSMPRGIRGQTAAKAKGAGVFAMLHRGLECLRKMGGHTKNQEYLEIEKTLLRGKK